MLLLFSYPRCFSLSYRNRIWYAMHERKVHSGDDTDPCTEGLTSLALLLSLPSLFVFPSLLSSSFVYLLQFSQNFFLIPVLQSPLLLNHFPPLLFFPLLTLPLLSLDLDLHSSWGILFYNMSFYTKITTTQHDMQTPILSIHDWLHHHINSL